MFAPTTFYSNLLSKCRTEDATNLNTHKHTHTCLPQSVLDAVALNVTVVAFSGAQWHKVLSTALSAISSLELSSQWRSLSLTAPHFSQGGIHDGGGHSARGGLALWLGVTEDHVISRGYIQVDALRLFSFSFCKSSKSFRFCFVETFLLLQLCAIQKTEVVDGHLLLYLIKCSAAC